MFHSSTIFALSSGGLPTGVAVIRLSGSGSKVALRSLCGFVPEDRRLCLADIKDSTGVLLDRGLVVSFSAPASFTGEDCVELHVHGGRASVAAVLEAIGSLDGFRPAEAGEFTRRAFVNGKLDLTSVEALGDLITAETEIQRRFALSNANGRQSALYASWRDRLLKARALVEADIDFSDEDGVPDDVTAGMWARLETLTGEMDQHLAAAKSGEIARDGFQVVILGAPNAGKSSLLNCMAKRDAAIVSDEPGTTRDLIEVVLDLNGVRTVLTDTAGLRVKPGRVEAMGIARALDRAKAADLVIALEDAANPTPVDVPAGVPSLVVGSKADLSPGGLGDRGYDFCISSVTGDGIDLLVERIGATAMVGVGAALDNATPSRSRHVGLIAASQKHILAALASKFSVEICAEELRLGSEELGRISGVIATEEVLGVIFSSFCIGK